MIKRVNKRGQDLSIGTLILIVLGIIVLVLLILGFSIGWGNLLQRIGIVQGSTLELVVSTCNRHVASNNKLAYCQEFVEATVDGDKMFVNCQFSRVEGSLEGKVECDESYETSQSAATEFCKRLANKGDVKDRTTVNGFNCKTQLAIENVPVNIRAP